MKLTISKAPLTEVQPLRNLFLAESRFQFVYNKCHGAGWADTYLFTIDNVVAGYGSLWGKNKRDDRDAIFEFWLLKPFQKFASKLFPEFIKVSGATFIECQSNDKLFANMLFEYGKNIYAEAILFEDACETHMKIPGTIFKKIETQDSGTEYALEQNGEIVANGGYVWNYNFPYIDMYYDVKENKRQQGFGCLITQELKKEAYRLMRVPAARCNVNNQASKATLLKAGMQICGHILIGEV